MTEDPSSLFELRRGTQMTEDGGPVFALRAWGFALRATTPHDAAARRRQKNSSYLLLIIGYWFQLMVFWEQGAKVQNRGVVYGRIELHNSTIVNP